MDSLHQKGYISDPATKNKSVWLSEEGAKLSKELFEKLFAPEQVCPDALWRLRLIAQVQYELSRN
jgi:hypothetical protein